MVLINKLNFQLSVVGEIQIDLDFVVLMVNKSRF